MDTTLDYARRVANTLISESGEWHELSSSVLFAHMEELMPFLWEGSVQAALDYYYLVQCALEVQRQCPDALAKREFTAKAKHGIQLLNNGAYHAMLSTYEREFLYGIAEDINDLVVT